MAAGDVGQPLAVHLDARRHGFQCSRLSVARRRWANSWAMAIPGSTRLTPVDGRVLARRVEGFHETPQWSKSRGR